MRAPKLETEYRLRWSKTALDGHNRTRYYTRRHHALAALASRRAKGYVAALASRHVEVLQDWTDIESA